MSRRICAFCDNIIVVAGQERNGNESICDACAKRYGIVMHDLEDGCGCDTK